MPNKEQVVTRRGPDAGALRRAVSDVMDGTLPVNQAMKARCVSHEALREALRVAGWVPPRARETSSPARRRTFGSGRRNGT